MEFIHKQISEAKNNRVMGQRDTDNYSMTKISVTKNCETLMENKFEEVSIMWALLEQSHSDIH